MKLKTSVLDETHAINIGHRWLIQRKPWEPVWVKRSLAMLGKRPLMPLLKGALAEGGVAQAAAALTLLPLEYWGDSMVPFVQSAGLSLISPSQLHCPLLGDEAETNNWSDWPALIHSRGLSKSRWPLLWCLEFVKQLQPPGLDTEAAAIADGWLWATDRCMPTPMELIAIRIKEEASPGVSAEEGSLDASERTFMAIAGKIDPLDWAPINLLSIVPGELLRISYQSGRLPRRVLNHTSKLGATTWRDLLSYDRRPC